MCVKKLIGGYRLDMKQYTAAPAFYQKSKIRYCHIENCANVTFQNNNNFPNTLLA